MTEQTVSVKEFDAKIFFGGELSLMQKVFVKEKTVHLWSTVWSSFGEKSRK